MAPFSTTNDGESDLIQRALRADEAAWEMLVRQHQESVFRLAYLFLGDPDEAEEVAQETFLRAHQRLDRFDTDRMLRPWLLSIAANLARNQRRSIGRYFNTLQRLGRSEASAQNNKIEELSFLALEARRLWSAVRRLGATDQQVIYLRYFLEMPVEETALAMHSAPGTVKSRLNRALKRLRSVIEQDYPDLMEPPV
jgi:RNA polymerase sigma-70 factor (ECF subfamily)